MKLQLRCNKSGLVSASLKAIAFGLKPVLGYRPLRTTKIRPKRKQFTYGLPVDKLTQYRWFQEQGLSALEFTTSTPEAQQWCKDGATVFGRKLLNASCGNGIQIYEPNPPDNSWNWAVCPVYTKYKKKKREFRVHVFKDTVVTVAEKRKRKGFEGDREHKVRNLAYGYVFCHDNVVEPEGLRELALKASKVTDSDFKGVDIGYNEKKKELFVIEVNSAPGIQGTNVNRYLEVIKAYV